jgi:dTDP-4-amino-4,6-dideoxygalactose transaminase
MRGATELAIHGGTPVFAGEWPAWPQLGGESSQVQQVLAGTRWAVSGNWTGKSTLDELFAQQFAEFVGASWCVPTDHGSSALLAAFTALGVGPGDEVIVPGLTWVACASTVIRAGAIPILVDIDADTLCVDPAGIEAAITERTAAILVVHLYSAMADMDRIQAIAAKTGIPVVEDAAQAHGARWHDRSAGSLGDVGTFSMQQGKVLTSGEGGAAVTSDVGMYAKLEQLRGDGRRYAPWPQRRVGYPDLVEETGPQGWNMHLSEVQAAMLLDGLTRLPDQNAARAKAAAMLDEAFSGIPGAEVIRPYPANTHRTYYHYVIRLDRAEFASRSIDAICRAVSAELGFFVHPPYPPLNAHRLYRPAEHPLTRTSAPAVFDPRQFALPEADRQVARTATIHHPALLADASALDAVVEAFDKVRRGAQFIEE